MIHVCVLVVCSLQYTYVYSVPDVKFGIAGFLPPTVQCFITEYEVVIYVRERCPRMVLLSR